MTRGDMTQRTQIKVTKMSQCGFRWKTNVNSNSFNHRKKSNEIQNSFLPVFFNYLQNLN